MRAICLMLALALMTPGAQAQNASDAERAGQIVTAFMALCPVSRDQAQRDADKAQATQMGLVDHGAIFSHGPGGLAREGTASMGGEHIDVSSFARADGYCLVRFAPVDRGALES